MDEPPVRVLLVEDEASVRLVAERMLALAGHAVISCTSGEEALEALTAQPDGIDVLVSDIHLGGITGFVLVEAVRRLRPSIGVVLMSGETEAEALDLGMATGTRFLSKPYRREHLEAAVADALGARSADA